MKEPRVELYTQCWNDFDMLPFFFRHYDPFVSRYIIYDDGSDAQTKSYLASHPNVELKSFVRSDPESFVLSEQSLSNECWKASRGRADWVIVTDIDEHLFHPHMANYLQRCMALGVTMIPALGFQMVSDSMPQSDAVLADDCPFGAPWSQMMKLSMFDPNQITEINFALGRHRAQPIGRLSVPAVDEVLLLHYKYLNLSRTFARHLALDAKLGAKDHASGWGHKYSWSCETLAVDWQAFEQDCVDTREYRPATGKQYPIAPWWDKSWCC